MEEAAATDEAATQTPRSRAPHIKKRALKNKSLSISFNEKDLMDYVTGFHKRKKKRRKEALEKQELALRRKRIEARKKRKLEREFAIYGGAAPDSGIGSDGSDEDNEGDEEAEPVASVAGTTMYDNGDMQVTVTTSEIPREQESNILEGSRPRSIEGLEKSKQSIIHLSKKQQLKKASKKRSRPKPQSKRDKKKGKKKNTNKRH
ncbi:ribosomal RNA-processing protein 17 [Olea europaea var. sylvestris]|uniref:ribosomal RNA-processing protein 17 n=1 Tax=Olea europaea var. sylvestris TaxID=158386 RepID=UPI000C1CDD3D|nr:ribosomal RNA-processing protein 17 [Olea europaea var. sylvestris]